MDEESRAITQKIATALEKIADALEKLPTNMTRSDARESNHQQNANQGTNAANPPPTVESGGLGGLMKGLGAVHIAGAAAAAVTNEVVQSNAWQGQQGKPYKKLEEFAEAAGEAGIQLSPEQLQKMRDYRRGLGRIATANKNIVDRQNSITGETFQEIKQGYEQKVTDILQNSGSYTSDIGTILFGTSEDYIRKQDALYEQNRKRQQIEYEGK